MQSKDFLGFYRHEGIIKKDIEGKRIMEEITIVGAGLAGSEAAWQAAKSGYPVRLFEMRPKKMTPAHHTGLFAELICSNSLRANSLTNAVGLLKEEMRQLDSLIIQAADATAVPAGGALAVDREAFSKYITTKISQCKNITVISEEVNTIPAGITVLASGPLTSDNLAVAIKDYLATDSLYFYDAAAPIVEKSSLDMSKIYLKSRYDKGTADYLNCPMSEEEFQDFYAALISAEVAELKRFEKEEYFEGCMPIEVMAKRGIKTMLFGPLKPVGLENPKTGKRPYAVVQLRQDNAAGSLYNLVGFQTHLKWGEQKRVFRLIPGLENAQFVRYGVMHRNTFLNSPNLLLPTYQSRKDLNVLFAGQMTGVEGYVESAASGLVAGLNAARLFQQKEPIEFPVETAIGSMAHYITHAEEKHFQPMNANFGLFPPLKKRIKDKKERYEKIAERSLESLNEFQARVKE